MNAQDTTQAVNDDELLAISDMDQMVDLVTNWHAHQVATVMHLLEVPDSVSIVMEGEEPFAITGDIQKGYNLGITLALNYLGKLPFTAMYEDPEPTTH